MNHMHTAHSPGSSPSTLLSTFSGAFQGSLSVLLTLPISAGLASPACTAHPTPPMSTASKNNIYGLPGSVELGNTTSGETPVRRLRMTKDKLTTQPLDSIESVPDILDYAARTHGTKDSFGWRDIVDIHEEKKEVKKMVGGKEVTETKTWKYFQLSDYKYISFVQVKEAAMEVGQVRRGGVGRGERNIRGAPARWNRPSTAATSVDESRHGLRLILQQASVSPSGRVLS